MENGCAVKTPMGATFGATVHNPRSVRRRAWIDARTRTNEAGCYVKRASTTAAGIVSNKAAAILLDQAGAGFHALSPRDRSLLSLSPAGKVYKRVAVLWR